MDKIEKNLLKEIADMHSVPEGAYNLRLNGKSEGRNSTENISIISKKDGKGIDIVIKPETKNESCHIPVILSESGLQEVVYNDFYIGENSDVLIVAGCGIHNGGCGVSKHDGVHTFHISKGARVKYVEKHYGDGEGTGERIMNPKTVIEIDENGYMEMETTQIKGVDSTSRETSAKLESGATLIIREKIFTHGRQSAKTDFTVDLNGENSSCHVISRSVAKDDSYQEFNSKVNGNSLCNGRTECDAIIMDNGKVTSKPQVTANHINASLVHEAAIGRIAGEQLIKLMTLGLTEKEAEEEIIAGFMK